MGDDDLQGSGEPMIALLALPDGSIEVRPTAHLGDLWGTFQGILKSHGGRSRKETSGWRSFVPVSEVSRIAAALEAAGLNVEVEKPVLSLLERERAKQLAAESSLAAEIRAAEELCGMTLYPFQREGAIWLRERSEALLGSGLGLGKTCQALVAHPPGRPLLVVCPAVVKGVWVREANRWRPDLEPIVCEGRLGFRWPGNGQMVVVNWDVLPPTLEEWQEARQIVGSIVGFFLADTHEIDRVAFLQPSYETAFGRVSNATTVVADEAHCAKERKAKRTVRFRALSKLARDAGGRCWLLTGTPLLNRPPELWTVLSMADLHYRAFGYWEQFTRSFGGYKKQVTRTRSVWFWGQPDQTVPERLRSVMLRHERKDVLPELPEKTWQDIECAFPPKYVKEWDELCRRIDESGLWEDPESLPGFEGFSKARVNLALSKIPTMLEIVEEYEEQEEPLIVFSAHREPIDTLAKRAGWAVITGDTSAAKRTEIEESFQRGELRGLGAMIQAGGVGITLTRACRVLFVDLGWTPALNEQAEDRAMRIGQTRGVLIMRLVSRHALDAHIHTLLTGKDALIARTVRAASRKGGGPDPIATVVKRGAKKAKQRVVERETDRWTAESPLEVWIESSLGKLRDDDRDHAFEQNGVGFSKMDGSFGHALASQRGRGLTERQWAAGYRLCRKYHRQVGTPPEEARCRVCGGFHVEERCET